MFLRGYEWGVNTVAISPNSHWLVIRGKNHTAQRWDLKVKDPSANPLVLRGDIARWPSAQITG